MRKNLIFILALFMTLPNLYAEGPAPVGAAGVPEVAPNEVLESTGAAEQTGKISLDFKDAEITTVLRVMSLKSDVNIVAGPEVKGVITIRLENVPWEKALDVVLRTYGYVYERDGNIIRVTTRENLVAEPLVTQTYVLNYTKAAEIQAAVSDMLTERGRIKVSERTNALVISDIPTNLYSVREVIKKLDQRTPQAYIDSKIVKTSLGQTENLGIEWKTGGTSNNLGSLSGASRPVTFPFTAGTNHPSSDPNILSQFYPFVTSTTTAANDGDNSRNFPAATLATPTNNTFALGTLNFTGFSSIMQMLKTRANTKVVSNPRIVVLNNQTASIHVGDNIPLPLFETNSTTGRLVVAGFNYDKLKTGVQMDVTPHINSEEEILVDLQPSVNSRGDTISFNTDLSAPIINETTAKSQVLIRSGETIAIGGLLTDNTQLSESKVPYLSDVPLLGKLFRSKRQTAGSGNSKDETLFFVTVTTVDTEGQPIGRRVESKYKVKQSAKSVTGQVADQEESEKVGNVSNKSGSVAAKAVSGNADSVVQEAVMADEVEQVSANKPDSAV